MDQIQDVNKCGWSWHHWMGGSDSRKCDLPFNHDGMHRMLDEDGQTLSAAPEGFVKRDKRSE